MSGFVYLPSFDSPSSSEYVFHVANADEDNHFKQCTNLNLIVKVYLPVSSMSIVLIEFVIVPENCVLCKAKTCIVWCNSS